MSFMSSTDNSANGAQRLCDALLESGVDTCFANPGTSEMHFVGALDARPRMRCILGLAEGVVTGAADGYGRMADRPAATLLHLGPGLANGLSNLHNARRARTPLVNVVGEHATDHLALDPPLASDIDSLAAPMSNWVRRAVPGGDVGHDAAEAVAAARDTPGIATLVLPADVAWSPAPGGPLPAAAPPAADAPAGDRLAAAARAIAAGPGTLLLLGGRALRAAPALLAQRLAAATGAGVLAETFNARIERGTGRAPIAKLPYPVALSTEVLPRYERIVLIGAERPVAFFAYPGKPGLLYPEGCEIVPLVDPGSEALPALEALAERLALGDVPAAAPAPEPPPDDAPLTPDIAAGLVARHLPEDAVVVDESVTSGRAFFAESMAGPRHDYLQLTGGSIGIGLPLSAGAAVACPGRRVVTLQADGSAMYSLQALWTQARERLDVTTVIFSNRSYAILKGEMANVGLENYGDAAARMMSLDDPALDWCALARGHGVEAARAATAGQLGDLLRQSFRQGGPFLIEACLG
ncbi:hypothetical protein OG2516_00449 [Oceanicola granulosus HTCC2516]|uniref:Acetolactate synthase large subunit n=2 Tax=Oceanicola granulosus TaxID=252302 RepID=Q2CJF0_OCEGH|nr:hypothetical protein OG2516_00449 [Oceanicola granulosus HTCC2516]